MLKLGSVRGHDVFSDCARNLNGHILVIGKSGSGKTVFAQKFILEIIREGGTVLAFDLHQTLASEQIFPGLNSEFNSYVNSIDAYNHGISCPLFTPLEFSEGGTENLMDTIYAIVEVLTRVFGLKCRQKAILKGGIVTALENGGYQRQGFPAIASVLRGMDNRIADSVVDRLELILSRRIFLEGPLFLKPQKINIVRLSRFDLFTQQVIAEVLLAYLWRLVSSCRAREQQLYIFLDEFQNLSIGPTAALTQFLTEGRKFHVNLLLVTQALTMNFNGSEQRRLLQSGMQLYFQPAGNEVKTIARLMGTSKEKDWERILCTLQRGEFVAVGRTFLNGKSVEGPLKISTV